MKTLSEYQQQELKDQIQRLHKRNSGDFQTLLRQTQKYRKVVPLNKPQYVAATTRVKEKYLEWGRGTGKTTFRGFHWSELLREMPRSTGLFIGPTYQFILTRIVPSLVQGLEMFGLYKDLHYFIGQQPPRSWRNSWGKAYQPPAKYDRYISFWQGTGAHMISHDVVGDGRALNSDWVDGDEAAMLSIKKLQENTDPTLRGTNKDKFANSVYFGSKLYTSSTPLTPDGQWFTDAEDLALEHPDQIAYIKATCKHNLHNLRDGYLEEAERSAYQYWVYEAEYLNKRPKWTKDSFYSMLDPDVHLYSNYDYTYYTTPGQSVDCRGDADLVRGQPLILGVDWGAAINCLSVNQHLQSINEFRTLKSMYVLGDQQKLQEDLFKEFNDYYSHHDNRDLFIYYDKSGNQNTGHTKQTRAEQARAQLNALGWRVNLMTTGTINTQHYEKYLLWARILAEKDPRLIRYRMNKDNCRELYLSMRNAKTKAGTNGEVKKDKRSEKSGRPRQEATDLSDANDNPIWGMFRYYLNKIGMVLPQLHIKKS